MNTLLYGMSQLIPIQELKYQEAFPVCGIQFAVRVIREMQMLIAMEDAAKPLIQLAHT
jgi:hypothetical protein